MNMYQNKNTGEVWELSHVETIPNNPKDLKVYVFKNGEHWAEDLFFKHFVATTEPKGEEAAK
jgi:hypothetical protein